MRHLEHTVLAALIAAGGLVEAARAERAPLATTCAPRTALIVKLAPGADIAELTALPDGDGSIRKLTHGDSPAHRRTGLDRLWLVECDAAAAEALNRAARADPAVEYVQRDTPIQAQAVPPSDPFFAAQWALNNTGQTGGAPDADIDALEAWSITTGSSNVIVAILDSGVDYSHPDLQANIWTNPGEIAGNGVDDDGDGYVDDVHGWDFYHNDNDPFDDNGHGTHVAGIIGAAANNGIGVVGVNQQVSIMPVKFIGPDNVGTISGAIAAIDYAITHGARVLNNSWIVSAAWGEPGYDQQGFAPALRDAIEAARLSDALFVAAAGNFTLDLDATPRFPASYDNDNVIAVAATDENDALAAFSNFGRTRVALAAPGTAIYSTVPTGACTYCDPTGYAYNQGASMSAAYASGAAALIRAAYPALDYAGVKSRLLLSGDVPPNLDGVTQTGRRLNVFNALEDDETPPAAISNLTAYASGSATVELSWTAPGDDGAAGTVSAYEIAYATTPLDAGDFDAAAKLATAPAPQPSGTPEVATVAGLQSATTYYFAVRALDNVGNVGAISNVVSAATGGAGLAGYWTLDDGGGTIAADASGNGNPGTLVNGPTWVSGRRGGALRFDGQDDLVIIAADPLAFDARDAITVGAWVKQNDGSGADTNDIVGQWRFPDSRSWILTHHNNDQYFWEIAGKAAITGGTVSDQWMHVVGTYDGITMRLYVNGVEVAAQSGLSGMPPASDADVIIAGQANLTNYFAGLIDDVRIYNDALSPAEIRAWMNWPSGDLDGDGRVDATDLAALLDCLTGPHAPNMSTFLPRACLEADLTGDGPIDLVDMAALLRNATSHSVSPPPDRTIGFIRRR